MATGTVTDCRSKFYDDGGPTGNYASILNTSVTKTLTIFAGGPITMTFSSVFGQCEVIVGDAITFYDGPNANAQGTLITGPITFVDNSTAFLPTVFAPSGSLTVVWTENGNGAGIGWNGGWFALAPDPIAPTASISPAPSCNTSIITLTTSQGVMCDSLKPNYFNITGPIFPIISTITPMPCNNGTTNVIQIAFTQPLNQNCNYVVTSTLFRKNKCDSVYIYPGLVSTFSIGNCPIQASINVTASNTVCAYSCTASIFAVVPSSVCLNFDYNWDPPFSNSPGPHPVCPTITTVYNCTITEQSTLTQTVITRTIFVIDPQIVPLPSPTICTGASSFNFTATPNGGTWIGPGITNATFGTFCPGCTAAGVKTVTYQVGNCFATYQFTTVLASAGSDDAACLNGPTFTVSGGSPGGGVWSGPHVDAFGVFTPTQVGTFVLTYSVGPCSDTKVVTVTNAIVVPTTVIDLCKSQWYTRFFIGYGITPFGGRYSKVGPGITNNVQGTFSPSLAGVGLHVITYSLASGCFETFTVNVLDIDVSPTTATTCPTHAPFLLSTIPSTAIPAGGTWSCITAGSIQNASSGLYNPSASSILTHTDILVYKATNGCPDTIRMQALKTNMDNDSLFFCVSSNSIQLSNSFGTFSYSPAGGTFTGTGVTFSGGNYRFHPSVAGVGIHTVYYDINTCRDSIKMIVYPSVVSVPDRTLCSSHPTLMVVTPPLPFGTTWSGPGIITPSLGVFNPSIVTAGNTYTFTYTNRASCGTGNVKIHVYQYAPATFGNLSTVYCFTDQNILFTTTPANGTLTAISTITNNTFNPSVVGAGNYTLTYEFGVGACLTSTTLVVKVHPQLTTTATISAPTICIGESSLLNVKAEGGLPTVIQYTYTWSGATLPEQPNQNVIPVTTTIYTVVTSDGCSDAAVDIFTVNVHPKYYPSFVSTPKQCYGDPGTTTVNITPNASYSYTWNTSPVQTTSVLSGASGKNYILKIKNTVSGCIRDTAVMIPGYAAIQALFSPNPNLSCIPFEDNLVTFLDLSNGALSGTWSFNGTTQTYTPGVAVSYLFNNPGSYNVRLDAVNDGNCPSSYELSICVLESTEIFLPDIFSPNKDGNNDVLYLRGNGVKEMKFQLFDRWGNKVFESSDVNNGWDGTYKGKDAEPGIYAYYLDVLMFNDKKITKKGDITLVR